MNVYFYPGQKKLNSTFAFDYTASSAIMMQCTLKKGTSILKPVLEIHVSWTYAQNTLLPCNLAYIPELKNRYYRVTNWSFNEPLTICALEVDVMATYKSQLGVQGFFITRTSDSTKANPDVADTSFPQRCGMHNWNLAWQENPLQPPAEDYGCFMIGVINNSGSFGCIEYYVMTYLVFMSFTNALCNMANLGDFTDVAEGVAKAIVNPFQYIVSCRWYPYTVYDFSSRGFIGGSVSSIRCGYYTVQFTGQAHYLAAGVLPVQFTNVISLGIKKNPFADNLHRYLNNAPYTRYFFNFYPFGSFELDPALLYGYDYLFVWYSVDLRTGNAICKIGTSVTGDNYTNWRMPNAFRTVEAQVGATVPMASIQSVVPTASQATVMGTVAAMQQFGGFGQMFKGAAASMAKGIGNLLDLPEDAMSAVYENIGAEPITKQDVSNIASAAVQANTYAEIHGMQGTVSHAFTNQVSLMGVFYVPAAIDNASYGYPCCNRYILNDISGYTICANARPELYNATQQEVEEVTRILNSGFIWE